ncbi:cytochrome P450 [Streptomyces zingiberis]|uniref:Cytochrome P450 n=1 Tax=Streptomyces zingiberis TaxID=2053010 RepID=A0ABX1BTT2_9ACTN|nr:cytochrome P450 [Streptomyces zingiberis]NJQ01124.1 cytochrome P450 [Streptomyces zingiberis]
MEPNATEVPTAGGLPLLGSMLDLRRDPLGTYQRAREEHGDVVRIVAGPPGLRTTIYFVFSPPGVQQILAARSADFRKDDAFSMEMRDTFGNGLLSSLDEDHLRQRRLLSPLFTKKKVAEYAGAICDEVDLLCEEWAADPEGRPDLNEDLSRLTVRMITRILFGADAEEAAEVVRRCMPALSTYTLRRGLMPVNLPRSVPTPANRRARAAQAELHALCDRLIERRRRSGGTSGATGSDDLLTLLINARSDEDTPLTDLELRDQVLVFLLAGSDTTATSLTFTLYLLARHPEIQDAAREEVRSVLGGRRPTPGDLDAMPSVERILKEAMRLYPAAPVLIRRAARDSVVDGHAIPAGAYVYVSPWVTHRHPSHWESPGSFDPERFRPEGEEGRHRYTWFPLGGGPRSCIGNHFAMLQMKLAVSLLLQRHRFTGAPEDVELEVGVTIRAAGAVGCRLTPADQEAAEPRTLPARR